MSRLPAEDRLQAVPEEPDINDGITIVTYVAEQGDTCRPRQGYGWQPVNVVNRQAWKEIEKGIDASFQSVAAGRFSCLHYYMIANQMTPSLLAGYTGQSTWLVRLHLRPFFFRRAGHARLTRYAELFGVSVEDLQAGIMRPPVYQSKRHG